MTERVGQQLGNYRLIPLLGEGGFAEVYLPDSTYVASASNDMTVQIYSIP